MNQTEPQNDAAWDPTLITRALLRAPSPAAARGLRAVDRGAPDLETLAEEHRRYGDALTALGVRAETLPPLPDYPDSQFVEDPALVFDEGAIVLRPGAASRVGEAAALEPALRERFARVITLAGGPEATVDGGDVLALPDIVLIGLSDRTNRAGAEALAAALSELGRVARVATPPPGVLHLKSACSLVGPGLLLATPTLLKAGLFVDLRGMTFLETAPGEDAAANALAINGAALMAEGYPSTVARVRAAGADVRTLPLAETEKLDAGLSCMSLRWAA